MDDTLIFPAAAWTRAIGYQIALDMLNNHLEVDGIFCFNDLLAFGMMKAYERSGVRIPQDIAVVGCDDIEECTYATPTLTSISPDKLGIAHLAVDHLLGTIAGNPPAPAEVSAKFDLVARESVPVDARLR